MTVIGEIAVNTVVIVDGAIKGARDFENTIEHMGHAAGPAAAAVLSIGTAAAFAGYELVKSQGEVAEHLSITTQKLDLSVEALSRYRFAGEQAAGMTGESL